MNTTNPKIAAEWHPTKNIPLTPYEVTSGSNKKVWWKCSKDHEWQVSINDRNTYNLGCPYCSNKKVLAGYNDLSSTNPTLASEWHPTKNKSLTPCNVTQGSKKKVWWKCSKGHEWEAAICDRYLGSNCPTCQNENHVSFSEKAIYFYIKKLFDDTVENFKFQDIKNMELDVYVPSLNLGIEFDGAYYHTDLARDIKKYKACKNKGIKLIRVREAGCKQSNEIADVVINVKSTDYADLTRVINEIVCIIGNIKCCVYNITADVQRDSVQINSLISHYEKEISLQTHNPKIAAEWHPTKNGNIVPSAVSFGSGMEVWWKCSKGHEWNEKICQRTSKDYGCPICSGKRTVTGINDLATLYPSIAAEWVIKKNLPLTPDSISPGSNKKVWWQCCVCRNEWKSIINGRCHRNIGCPVCAGKKIIPGYNDLETLKPSIATEWNYEKNGLLGPSSVSVYSSSKVWWKCCKGHSWQSTVASRSYAETGCPYCGNKKVLARFNDLAYRFPQITLEWNYAKNGELKPNQILATSKKKVWWICSCGKEWQANVYDRCIIGRGCPACAINNNALKHYKKCVLYIDGIFHKEFDSIKICGEYLLGKSKGASNYVNKETRITKGKFTGHLVMIKIKRVR